MPLDRNKPAVRFAATAVIALSSIVSAACGQSSNSGESSRASGRGKLDGGEALVLRQEQVADKYRRFEEVLLRMAELSAGEDPERAALLRRVVAQSNRRLVGIQFEELVELLRKERFGDTVTGQEELIEDLRGLLRLLLSEDRARRMESEKARIRALVNRINTLIREEKTIRAETEKGSDADRLAERQGKLAEQTGELAGEMRESSSSEGESGEQSEEGDSSESESGGKGEKTDEGKQGEQSPEGQEGEQPSAESESSESQQSQQGESQGQSQEGQPQQGSAQQGEAQEGEGRAQNNLEAAQQRMQAAQESLEQARREEAADQEDQALRELEQAKAELEEILRQLREEEIERMLAWLETRFRQMLKIQTEVYEGTVRLDDIPDEDRDRSTDIEANRLSRREATIVDEADKVLNLLREDGTAVAFPEAVMQMREDLVQIAGRLAESQVGDLTQAIEQDVIAALEELIEALQKEQKQREGEQEQGESPQGPPQDPSLIDSLAELKMIRSLQMRVNRRTLRYSDLVDGQQASIGDVRIALEALAEREERIYRATRDIVVGRNQ